MINGLTITPSGLELLGLKDIAIPEIRAVKLKDIEEKNGQYEVHLYRGIKETFPTRGKAVAFLHQISEQLNQCLRFLNTAYIKIQMTVQPYIYSLSTLSARAYNELKYFIDTQMIMTRRNYANANWAYFKQVKYIVIKLLQLISIGSEVPEVKERLSNLLNAIAYINHSLDGSSVAIS